MPEVAEKDSDQKSTKEKLKWYQKLKKSVKGTKEVKPREEWQKKFDFLVACIGASVGLGNVWRFPYLCYKNGGGAFLIPYFFCAIFAGVPMFFLEVTLGQFMGEGAIGSWRRLVPLLQGIGIASTILVFFLPLYYNVIMAWTFYYLFASFTSTLPFGTCGNSWNTPTCTEEWGNTNGTNTTDINGTQTDPYTEYWENKVLGLSSGLEEVGTPKWDLVLCLLLSWVVVYLCICKGIKSAGKVMYFTALAPYVLLLILLCRGVTLPGSLEGIKFYMLPDWAKVIDAGVWTDAGTQIFYSMSLAQSKLTAMGSHNKYHDNCFRDCILYGIVNCLTSIMSGFVIFPVLGFMAYEQNVSIADVAESGPGLAFIAYPKAVAQLPVAPLWAVLFFITLIFLGLDSQFVAIEGLNTSIIDEFPKYLRRGYRSEIFIMFTSAVMFLCGIPMVTNGGAYIFQLFDYYFGSRILLVIILAECIGVAYFYGVRRYHDNVTAMLGFDIGWTMKICWVFITPALSVALLGLAIYGAKDLTYNKVYKYPDWTVIFGWGLGCSGLAFIPILAVYELIKEKGSFRHRLRESIRPRLEKYQLRPQDSIKDLCPPKNNRRTNMYRDGEEPGQMYDNPVHKYDEESVADLNDVIPGIENEAYFDHATNAIENGHI